MTKSLALTATAGTDTENTATQAKTALPVGSWSKKGGQAHYTVSQDQTVTYTNRRGETSASTDTAFLKAASQGFRYNHANPKYGKPVSGAASQVDVSSITFED